MAKKRKKTRLTARDLFRTRIVTDCRIAPAGDRIVCSILRNDEEKLKKHSDLWLVDADGRNTLQFTHGDHVDQSPRWSPDGTQIAFLSNRADEKQFQIYIIATGGGEARQLTELKGEFSDLSWSPEGRLLLFCFRRKDQEAIEREEDEERKKRGIVAREYTRVFYKQDGEGYLPHERHHLWTVNVESGKTRQLTKHDVHDEVSGNWSPDGKRIVFCSNRAEDPDMDPDAIGLYTVTRKGGSLKEIETPVGPKRYPVYSPDGLWIAYLAQEGRGNWWQNTNLWVVPVDGGEARNLTEPFDFNVENVTINDLHGIAPTLRPVWSADSKGIFFQVSQHGNTYLYRITLDGELAAIVDREGVVGAFDLDREGSRIVMFHAEMTSPGDVWVHDVAEDRERRLTEVNDKWLSKIDLGRVESQWFKGSDGNDLQGWIIKPPGFRSNRKYPAILEIHGGPQVQYGNFFMHEFWYLAAQGYVVFFCNPRGGSGYGTTHCKAIWDNWGTVDYDDLMKWTDIVCRNKWVDGRRMGVTGGSYGGYMTNWIIGQTKRFKAAVTQRCVSNLIDMWGSSDFNWVFQQVFGDVPPWENPENYWRQSPIMHIGNVQTPTLVIHSEQDLRCPQGQGEQMFVALKRLGVDTKLVLFPEESHGLSRGGRTDRRIKRLEEIVAWFDKYLK